MSLKQINTSFFDWYHKNNRTQDGRPINVSYNRNYKIEFYRYCLNDRFQFSNFGEFKYIGFMKYIFFMPDDTLDFDNIKILADELFPKIGMLNNADDEYICIPTISGSFDLTILYIARNIDIVKNQVQFDVIRTGNSLSLIKFNGIYPVYLGAGGYFTHIQYKDVKKDVINNYMTSIHANTKSAIRESGGTGPIFNLEIRLSDNQMESVTEIEPDYSKVTKKSRIIEHDFYYRLISESLEKAYEQSGAYVSDSVIELGHGYTKLLLLTEHIKKVHASLGDRINCWQYMTIRLGNTWKVKKELGDRVVDNLIKDVHLKMKKVYSSADIPKEIVINPLRIDKDRWAFLIISSNNSLIPDFKPLFDKMKAELEIFHNRSINFEFSYSEVFVLDDSVTRSGSTWAAEFRNIADSVLLG